MNEDTLLKSFEHNNWANMQIIQACTALSDEQLDAQPQSATKGSIRDTLSHMVTSQRGYLALLTVPVDARPRTLIAFADLQDSARLSGDGLLALLKDGSSNLAPRVQTTDGYYVDAWAVLLQVINHATEHREQIKSMLTALGLAAPEVDGWAYAEATNALTPIST